MKRSPRNGREMPEPEPNKCKAGHLMTEANSYRYLDRNGHPRSRCRACEFARKRSFAKFRDRVRAGR